MFNEVVNMVPKCQHIDKHVFCCWLFFVQWVPWMHRECRNVTALPPIKVLCAVLTNFKMFEILWRRHRSKTSKIVYEPQASDVYRRDLRVQSILYCYFLLECQYSWYLLWFEWHRLVRLLHMKSHTIISI